MNTTLLITLFSTAGLALASSQVIAQENVDQFGHGCGTGCVVQVERVGEIQVMTYNGYEIRSSAFHQVVTGSLDGDTEGVVYYFASCPTRELAFSPANAMPADPEAWTQLTGTNHDYTTVAAGRGFYFDAICQGVPVLPPFATTL